jgi:hypothetical protein
MNALKDTIKQPVWEVTVKFWNGNQVELYVKAPAQSNLVDLIYGRDATSPLIEAILCILEKHKEPLDSVSSVSIAAVIAKKEPPKKAGIIKPFVRHRPANEKSRETRNENKPKQV